MRLYLLPVLLLATAALQSQTPTPPRMMVWTVNGIAYAPMPANWALTFDTTGTPTLNIATPVPHDDVQQLTAVQGVFALACSTPSTLHAYRNGIKQASGIDFDLATNTVTFRSTSTPQQDDTLEFEYGCSGN